MDFGLILCFLSNRQLGVVLDGTFLQEHSVIAGIPRGSILAPTLFLLHVNDYKLAIYADDATRYSKWKQTSDMWQQLELALELESDLQGTADCGRKWLVEFSA